MSQQTLFADTIINASVQNGLVRLEWGSLAKPEKEGQQATLEVTHRVVMPIEGFVSAMQLQQKLLEALAARAKTANEASKEAPKES